VSKVNQSSKEMSSKNVVKKSFSLDKIKIYF